MGNVSSKNSYVLNDKPFNNIKKQLLNHITKYFDEVISTSDKIVPYITQSWLNYTKENEYHHSHAHPNSFVSGVLYIDANKENVTFQATVRPCMLRIQTSHQFWHQSTP